MRTLEILRCLSDLTRARIVHLLSQRGPELCVCDIIAVLGLPQSTISRQLMMLRYLGVVQDRRVGIWMHYSIAPAGSHGHELVLEVVRKGFSAEPVFAEDLSRFDELKRAGKVRLCNDAPKRKSRRRGRTGARSGGNGSGKCR